MVYVTREKLETEIPAPHLADAVDDDREGGEDADKLDALLLKASSAVDGFLAPLYAVPFADPAPAACQEAAFCFAGELVYARRGVPTDDNPFTKRAEAWRKKLDLMGKGEMPLDSTIEIPFIETPEQRVKHPGLSVSEETTVNDTTR